MRGSFAAIFFCVGAVACVQQNRTLNATADYESEKQQIVAKMNAELVAPMCTAEVSQVKTCGLLVYEYRRPQRMQAFEAAKCGGGQVMQDPTCLRQYADAFFAEVEARYTHAVPKEVTSKCDTGADCTRWDQMELAWLESHNAHVFADAKRALQDRSDIHDRQVEQLEKQERDNRQAWATVGAVMKGALSASEGANGAGNGCANSMGCPMGHVCMIPSGATSGTCMQPR